MKKEFVNIKLKSGNRFYTSSKEPVEGAELVETKFGNYYHKVIGYIKSDKLISVSLRDTKYGEKLQFLMEGKDNTILDFSIPTINNKGRLEAFAASAAMSIGGLKIGHPIEINVNKKDKNEAGYLYSNIFFRQFGDEDIKWTFDYSEVPKPVEKINKITKKSEWNSEDKDAFLYAKLVEACMGLKPEKSESDDYPKAKDKKVVVPVEDDDLPF